MKILEFNEKISKDEDYRKNCLYYIATKKVLFRLLIDELLERSKDNEDAWSLKEITRDIAYMAKNEAFNSCLIFEVETGKYELQSVDSLNHFHDGDQGALDFLLENGIIKTEYI